MIEVEAIKNLEDISTITQLLESRHSRDIADVWEIGIQLAMRITDQLSIEYSSINKERKEIELIEGKTKKLRTITLNDKAMAMIDKRRSLYPDDVYLFQSHGNRAKAKSRPLTRSAVAAKYKDVGDKLNLKLSTHSMRKTRGYHLYSNGTSIEHICKAFNHSCPKVTLRYIGIDADDIKKTYLDLEL